jgi:hypothetical protein
MAKATLYEMLGITRRQTDEVAKRVRASFSESKGPTEWIARLKDDFGIDQKNAEIFACGWFAGKYAGVSEVFNAVQREVEEKELKTAEKSEKERENQLIDGYA